MPRFRFSAIVCGPASASDREACVRSLREAGVDEVLLAVPETDVGDVPVRALNDAVARSRGDTLLLVAPVARVWPELPARWAEALGSRPDVGFVFGDYLVRTPRSEPVCQPLFADPADLSEWSSAGYVQAIPRPAWDRAGGLDPSFRVAAHYDLRLRLAEHYGFARVCGASYEIDLTAAADPASGVATALEPYFTPESAALPGFAYLRLQDAVREEIERAFHASLARRGARLEGPNAGFVCPDEGSHPTVSVVIPTRNRRRLVERAIDSVRLGEFQDFEVLVVDNGSTDGTYDFVASLGERDPRVRALRSPGDRGVGTALNVGLAAARGRLVSQLDSDDEYTPRTLAAQVAALEANPSWALAISYYDVIDDAGETLPQFGIIRHDEYDRNNLLRTGGAGAVRTWHRCVLRALGGFDAERFDSYAEDYDLVLRASERYDVGRVHEVLYRVRRHGRNSDDVLDLEYRAGRKLEARRRALARRVSRPR